MSFVKSLRQEAHQFNVEIVATYLALKDPRVSRLAGFLLFFAIGYALSPLDVIPDAEPVFGFLDDLVVVPLAIALTYRLIPRHVLGQARVRAWEALGKNRQSYPLVQSVIPVAWLLLSLSLLLFLIKII